MLVCRFPEDHRRSPRKHADPTVRAADKKCSVQITFKTSGGIAYFPGLAAGKTIDVDTLPQDRQAEIRRLLESTKFFDLPARTAAKPGAADYQTYTIMVSDRDRQKTVAVSDPVPPELARLVELLRELTSR